MRTRLFTGKDVVVEVETYGSKNLWICFNEVINVPNSGVPNPWGYSFFNKRSIDSLHILNFTNHWYQTLEMYEVLPLIVRVCKNRTYENIILYGLSMGACACLMFANSLPATKVLALSPYFLQDQSDKSLKELFPIPETIDAQVYVIYGKLNELDQYIPQKLPKGNVHLYPMNDSDHNSASTLTREDILKDVVLCVEEGKEDTLGSVLARLM